MAATKKKRDKKYQGPRDVRLNIAELLFEGDAPLSASSQTTLLITVHWAASSLARGMARKDDWDTIVNAFNCAKIFCEKAANAQSSIAVLNAGHNAMIDIAERSYKIGVLRLGVGNLTRINAGLALYEQLIGTVTKRMHTAAINEVDRRMQRGEKVSLQRAGTPRMTTAQLAA
jgi:hypothetical protein